MKKLLLACALLSSVSASVYAQAHDKQPPSADDRATKMQKVLQLSDEQAGKVKKVFDADTQQRKALVEKYKPQFDAFHADMKKQREQTHTQLNAVLTPKQQQALETMHDGRGMRGYGMGMGMGMMGKMGDEQCPMYDKDEHPRAPQK